ncbi:uncharacterized protein LOC120977521 [Bufo bufo]|uniref:uncharacterized protein LOC120977521 n=1 Tax=Bufo bufo TaxID=8384 RepID=UPI001ABE40F7|nr:uncharacterized protein LOC120977521 [Bufo bufo]
MAAMGSVTHSLTKSISDALSTHPGVSSDTAQPDVTVPHASRTQLIGESNATPESATSRKRASSRQAERARKWKCARAQTDLEIDSEVDSDEEVRCEDLDYPDEGLYDSAHADPTPAPTPAPPGVSSADVFQGPSGVLTDPLGDPLFDPDSLHHPRSAEWLPLDHVAQYLAARVRCPLTKEARNKLKAECPRPIVANKVCDTPSVDPKMVQFLAKSGWNPRRGLESALKATQDKLLDLFGPLTKIFELAEIARETDTPVDPEDLRGWVQRAICIAGNVNTSLSIERRKAILFKIEPKLVNLALTEAGGEAQGLLFGESFIKDMGKFVGAFTALDKAQSSMRRVFQGRFSARAGNYRGRSAGRSSFHARGSGRGSYGQRSFSQRYSPQDTRQSQGFFPSRGAPSRRPFRGGSGFRRPLG